MKKIIITISLATAGAAHAEFLDGNKLLDMLRGDVVASSMALGYITGVADSVDGSVYCPPGNVTTGQLRDMVRNFLERQPQFRAATGDTIVRAVAQAAFPCKKPATPSSTL